MGTRIYSIIMGNAGFISSIVGAPMEPKGSIYTEFTPPPPLNPKPAQGRHLKSTVTPRSRTWRLPAASTRRQGFFIKASSQGLYKCLYKGVRVCFGGAGMFWHVRCGVEKGFLWVSGLGGADLVLYGMCGAWGLKVSELKAWEVRYATNVQAF